MKLRICISKEPMNTFTAVVGAIIGRSDVILFSIRRDSGVSTTSVRRHVPTLII